MGALAVNVFTLPAVPLVLMPSSLRGAAGVYVSPAVSVADEARLVASLLVRPGHSNNNSPPLAGVSTKAVGTFCHIKESGGSQSPQVHAPDGLSHNEPVCSRCRIPLMVWGGMTGCRGCGGMA